MSKKLRQRFIVLCGMLFLLAGSILVLPDSRSFAANTGYGCNECLAECSADYDECVSSGYDPPWKCSQYRMNCWNYCHAEYCIQP